MVSKIFLTILIISSSISTSISVRLYHSNVNNYSFINRPQLFYLLTVTPLSYIVVFCLQIEVLDNYSDPKDTKAYLQPGEEASDKVYTSPNREYSQPYPGQWPSHMYIYLISFVGGNQFHDGVQPRNMNGCFYCLRFIFSSTDQQLLLTVYLS